MKYIAKKISAMLLLLSAFSIGGMQQPRSPLDNNIAADVIQDENGKRCMVVPVSDGIVAAINTIMGVTPRRPMPSLKSAYGFVRPRAESKEVHIEDGMMCENSPCMCSVHGTAAACKKTYQLTEFQMAASAGDLERAQSLLDKNVDIDWQAPERGYTALHLASRYGRESVVELLLARGANVILRSHSGGSALHFAAANYQTSIAQRLIKANTSLVNFEDNLGNTPLHYAAFQGDLATTKLLLGYGAQLKYNRAQQNPLEYARENFEQTHILQIPETALPHYCKPNQTLKLLKVALKKSSASEPSGQKS